LTEPRATQLAEWQEPPRTPFVWGNVSVESLRDWLREQQLDVATQMILERLDKRIARGDAELQAVRLLLHHYSTIISRLVPMAHLGCAPLRPDDRLYECFAEFVDLLHRQQNQIREMEAIITELV
jgi:hypothetical protein